MEQPAAKAAGAVNRSGRMNIAIAGGGLRATSVLRLLSDVENLSIVAVYDSNRAAPAVRLAEELGIFTTTEISELAQISGLDLVLDMSEEPTVQRALDRQRPSGMEVIGGCGADLGVGPPRCKEALGGAREDLCGAAGRLRQDPQP